MLTKLVKPTSSLCKFFRRLCLNWWRLFRLILLGLILSTWCILLRSLIRSRIIWYRLICSLVFRWKSLARPLTYFFGLTLLCRLVTFLNQAACIILSTNRYLCTVRPILTVHLIRTIHSFYLLRLEQLLCRCSWCCLIRPCDSHIEANFFKLCLKISLPSLLVLPISFHLLFKILNLYLDIVEWPLLWFLHLDHHLLNLLELLEIVSLHLLDLFLLRDQHIHSKWLLALIVIEKCLFNFFSMFVLAKSNR